MLEQIGNIVLYIINSIYNIIALSTKVLISNINRISHKRNSISNNELMRDIIPPNSPTPLSSKKKKVSSDLTYNNLLDEWTNPQYIGNLGVPIGRKKKVSTSKRSSRSS